MGGWGGGVSVLVSGPRLGASPPCAVAAGQAACLREASSAHLAHAVSGPVGEGQEGALEVGRVARRRGLAREAEWAAALASRCRALPSRRRRRRAPLRLPSCRRGARLRPALWPEALRINKVVAASKGRAGSVRSEGCSMAVPLSAGTRWPWTRNDHRRAGGAEQRAHGRKQPGKAAHAAQPLPAPALNSLVRMEQTEVHSMVPLGTCRPFFSVRSLSAWRTGPIEATGCSRSASRHTCGAQRGQRAGTAWAACTEASSSLGSRPAGQQQRRQRPVLWEAGKPGQGGTSTWSR